MKVSFCVIRSGSLIENRICFEKTQVVFQWACLCVIIALSFGENERSLTLFAVVCALRWRGKSCPLKVKLPEFLCEVANSSVVDKTNLIQMLRYISSPFK